MMVRDDRRILRQCFVASLVLEFAVLTAVGWKQHWMTHPKMVASDSNFVEAQIFEMPQEAHLVEPQKLARPAAREQTLSHVPQQGREAKVEESAAQEQNETQGGVSAQPNHGPVAVFSPSPKIPPYMQDQDLHTSVVIDFLISAQGQTTPRLVNSSGNPELDAIALSAAAKWQFRPAEKDHHAIDSKVRLRILFEVQ